MEELKKNIAKMRGDQLFQEFSMSQKRVKLYKGILEKEEYRLKLLTDVIYNGKQIEEDNDDYIDTDTSTI